MLLNSLQNWVKGSDAGGQVRASIWICKACPCFHHFASRACRNRVGAKAVSRGSRARPLRGSFPTGPQYPPHLEKAC